MTWQSSAIAGLAVAAVFFGMHANHTYNRYRLDLRTHDDQAFEARCKARGGEDLLLMSQEHRICVKPGSLMFSEVR